MSTKTVKAPSLRERTSWKKAFTRDWHLYLLLLLPIALVIMYNYAAYPGLRMVFYDYKPAKGYSGSKWVGMETFQKVFKDKDFVRALKNSIVFNLLDLAVAFPMPIILALMLNELRGQKYKRVVQSLSYLPHFISWVILTGIFMVILSPTRGPVNTLLKSMGMESIYFLGDPKYFRGTLVVTGIWKGIGWGSIVYLAALGGVNEELYDAARVDGCGRWGRIWHVTLPGIAPVVTIMLILNMGSLVEDDFDQIFNLLNDAVLGVGDVLGTFIYRQGVKNLDYGYATAVELFRNIISLVLVLSANFISKRINEYGLW